MQERLNFIVAQQDDCVELAQFNKELIDSGGSKSYLTLPELQERMKVFLSTDYYAIIFEVDGKHIGYTLVTKQKDPMFIRHFLVLPEYRRKGYGHAAFLKLLSFFNIDKIDLTVLYNNEIGRRFWNHCGLKPYEIVMHYRE